MQITLKYCFYLFLFMLLAFRLEVGSDWQTYSQYANTNMSSGYLATALVETLAPLFPNPTYGFMFMMASIQFLVLLAAENILISQKSSLLLISYVCFGLYFDSFNIVGQSTSLCLLILSLVFWIKRQYSFFLITFAIAFLFHYSSLIFVVYFVLDRILAFSLKSKISLRLAFSKPIVIFLFPAIFALISAIFLNLNFIATKIQQSFSFYQLEFTNSGSARGTLLYLSLCLIAIIIIRLLSSRNSMSKNYPNISSLLYPGVVIFTTSISIFLALFSSYSSILIRFFLPSLLPLVVFIALLLHCRVRVFRSAAYLLCLISFAFNLYFAVQGKNQLIPYQSWLL